MKNTIQGNLTEKHPAATFIYAYTWKFCSPSVFNASHFPESTVGEISEARLALTHLEPLQDRPDNWHCTTAGAAQKQCAAFESSPSLTGFWFC